MASSDRPIIIGAAPTVNLPAPSSSSSPPTVEYPVPQSSATSAAPLPPLTESDQPLHDSLATVPGAAAIDKMLEPQNLIRHIVASVDNLPRKKVAVDLRPIHATPGQFQVVSAGDQITIAPQNAQRYGPFIDLVRQVDERQLADVYFHYYPLFQQSYEDLGYPSEYFNDRVIEVIDNLLATPDVKGPIELVQPNVMYQYADPKLEALSAGQKTLLRLGAANEALIKDKLRSLRALLATHPHATGRSAASAATP
jgi:Protein of unknown function (DUF3014)